MFKSFKNLLLNPILNRLFAMMILLVISLLIFFTIYQIDSSSYTVEVPPIKIQSLICDTGNKKTDKVFNIFVLSILTHIEWKKNI
ncbi:MAG: hypothetical protein HQL46_15195 [Gammaproteobacteria bacterium]|nr:hypothetical protein [Gammaproteobacteria bacterium]